MATTATINFSNEKRTGTFEYKEGSYVINGSASADLAGVLLSSNGQIRKGEEYVGEFYANKSTDDMKVNISGVDAADLSATSPIVTACIAKVASHFA